MNKPFSILSVFAALLLSGCAPSREQAKTLNVTNLQAGLETVGKLPDGREIKRTWVYSPSGNNHHFIYVVDGATTVSNNRTEMRGKVLVTETDVVIINGVEYTRLQDNHGNR